ncbi:MAG: trypsin-like peptidase domain-containing protein [Christensenellaceae bacterium]|jgi:S1-C subfamily serine protease|nr:trypsin-like peptidase domain-containing protein [Christensenellaceae bacterium]
MVNSKGLRRASRALCLSALALALGLCLGCGRAAGEGGAQGPGTGLSRTALSESSMESVARAVSPSVVGIAALRGGEVQGIGSGVVAHEKGYVLTNFHVAQVGSEFSLVFEDGTKASATLCWGDAALDLALLKAEGSFSPASLGSAGSARPGESVLVIGTPLTLQFQHTVTHGIVSATGRALRVPALKDAGESSFMEDLIQTDAFINPGNSGGPLVNMRGEVIGIVTMKVEQAAGIGFAIPIDIAAPIIKHFAQKGSYETPYLGVSAFDAQIARFFDERLEMETGLCVIETATKSPAAKAGLQAGDILLYADGRELKSMLDLRYCIYSHEAGEEIGFDLERGGRRIALKVKLEPLPLG